MIFQKQVLTEDECQRFLEWTKSYEWKSGKLTAGGLAREIKNNFELESKWMHDKECLEAKNNPNTNHPPNMAMFRTVSEISKMIGPMHRLLPPIISKYEVGNEYGWHADGAVMNGTRTDYAVTLCLKAADEGGELEIEGTTGTIKVKLKPGEMIFYPCHYMHRVTQITKGERIAMLSWGSLPCSDWRIVEGLAELQLISNYMIANFNEHKDKKMGEVFKSEDFVRLIVATQKVTRSVVDRG